MKDFLTLALILLAGFTLADDRPNIVIFMSDDMGWNDVGYHGSAIETPNIDRLGVEGMELDRFYVHPVCSPTRAALMTSRLPIRFGISGPLPPDRGGLPEDEHLFPASFQAAGYQTALVGKWHLGSGLEGFAPENRGFDSFYGFRTGMIDYYSHLGDGGKLDWWRNGELLEEEGYSTDLLGAEAVRVIEGRDPEKPLFLLVPFNAPHGPQKASEELKAKYASLGRGAGLAACVDSMDQAIGAVLDALDAQGMTENTMVMFFCDNGGKGRAGIGEGGLALVGGKGSMREGGVRVPCVLRWPAKIKPGSVCEHMVSVTDLGPTLASAAGVPLLNVEPLDGKDQWAAIEVNERRRREPMVIGGARGAYTVIADPYKFINDADGEQLYQIREDPVEATNLVEDKAEIVAKMKTVWEPFASMGSKKGKGKGGRPKGGKSGREGKKGKGKGRSMEEEGSERQ